MTTLKLYAAAFLAAFVFLALGAALDGPSDTAAAQAQADYLHELQQAQASLQALDTEGQTTEQIARATCTRLHGPAAQVLPTADGDWVCRKPSAAATLVASQ